MSDNVLAFGIKAPVSAWNKPLKADFRKLFVSLSKAAVHGLTGKWPELGLDAAESATSLGITTSPAELAWILIRNALSRAIVDLVKDSLPPGNTKAEPEYKAICQGLDLSLEDSEITIDEDFFNHPERVAILQLIRLPFAQWLLGYELTEAAATDIAARLPSYFIYGLHAEWRAHTARYEPIRLAINTPFTTASTQQQAWQEYAARLQRLIDEPMFAEPFGLRSVYVPLRGFYTASTNKNNVMRFEVQSEKDIERNAIDLHTTLREWLQKNDPNDTIRVLSGGPGSGKSSLAKMFAADMLNSNIIKLIFIPLHQFNISDSLPKAIEEYIQTAGLLISSPLDQKHGEDRILLIFDGLDELALLGRMGADAARDFIREVQKSLSIFNNDSRRVFALITGREPVIQATASEFRERHQVLHVLPYYLMSDEKSAYQDPNEILKRDQRDLWWKAYGVVTGQKYNGLPKALSRKDLHDITAQPLLNYLIALAFGRKKVDFSHSVNLNLIYADLLLAVFERGWEKGRRYLATNDLTYIQFSRILEEIALAAWHGNGRTTTVSAIEAHCATAGMTGLLNKFADGVKVGVARLLTAFYFRQFGHSSTGERTFEFTHKSFREYLTAVRIVRALDLISSEIKRKEESFDRGWDFGNGLEHWIEVCGPTGMDEDLLVFLLNEIKLRGSSKALEWQHILAKLISVALSVGMPMDRCGIGSFTEQVRQARNAEEALLAVMSKCAKISGETLKIAWPKAEHPNSILLNNKSKLLWDISSAGAWIARLQGQRVGPHNPLVLECLSNLDLSNCCFDMGDFYEARMLDCDLSNAHFHFACLSLANLSGSNLNNSLLSWANFSQSNLQGATFINARITLTNFSEANLDHTNFSLSNGEGANFSDASIKSGNFSKADLEKAQFNKAILTMTNFEGADLEGADFSGADLTGANFHLANISRAKFTGTPPSTD